MKPKHSFDCALNNNFLFIFGLDKARISIVYKKMGKIIYLSILVCLFISFTNAGNSQLTFELPDNENQCFYEHINKDTQTIIEFQVVTGGNYDVDMTMKDPKGKVIYQDKKKQYDSFHHQAQIEGFYINFLK